MKKNRWHLNSIIISTFFLLVASHNKLFAQVEKGNRISQIIEKEYERLENLYKYIHAHPELSLEEKQTAVLLTEELKKSGCTVSTGIGGYGIVGIMNNGPGPVVMIRTDMDALPLKENTGVDFASKKSVKGKSGSETPVMHACGHDLHMASWIGVSNVLNQLKNQWKGTVLFVGQPAEENGQGARAMLADGLFSKFPRPDFALALHVNSALESGKVGLCSGYALANIDAVDIVVKGKGGHGSVPQLTIDPIVLASKMILGFQTIVSREISPQKPALITIGAIQGGTSANIIPDEVKLKLTVRSFDDEVQKLLIEKIRRTCEGIAYAAGVEEDNYPEIEIKNEYIPAVYNDPKLTENITTLFIKTLGKEQVVRLSPEMFGEDFGWYGREQPSIPTLIYSLGSVNPKHMKDAKTNNKSLPSTHSSLYLPDLEPSLKTGILSMTSALLYFLSTP